MPGYRGKVTNWELLAVSRPRRRGRYPERAKDDGRGEKVMAIRRRGIGSFSPCGTSRNSRFAAGHTPSRSTSIAFRRPSRGNSTPDLSRPDSCDGPPLSIPRATSPKGRGRESNRDLTKFLVIAIASSSELEYHLQFCADAALIARRDCDACLAETVELRRMLIGLLKKVRSPTGPVAVVSRLRH